MHSMQCVHCDFNVYISNQGLYAMRYYTGTPLTTNFVCNTRIIAMSDFGAEKYFNLKCSFMLNESEFVSLIFVAAQCEH